MSDNKQKYIAFCNSSHHIPLFQQYWWLDIVCGKNNWDVCLYEKNNIIEAAWTYYTSATSFGKKIVMPPMTPWMGLWIAPLNTPLSSYKQLSRDKDIYQNLVKQLPSVRYIQQRFHYTIQNWLPLYWEKFTQTTKYTYIIPQLQKQSTESLLNAFQPNMRNKINKAKKIVTIDQTTNIDILYSLVEKTFLRQHKTPSVSKKILSQIHSTLTEKNQGTIFIAKDADGHVHSALYLIWDKQSAYVHMVGEDPAYRSSGAGIALIWEALLYTKQILKLSTFDFEGSMIENVEQVRRACGAMQQPYMEVQKYFSHLLKIAHAIKKY